MTRKPLSTWFDGLNRAKQWTLVLLFFAGLGWGFLTAGWSFWVWIMDGRIRQHVDPLIEMLEFSMKQTGQWEPYIEEKARRERDRKIKEATQVRAPQFPLNQLTDN